jgi:preprotein translocase subunit YajC
MQVMLNILPFFACFSIAVFIALRPKRAKQDVEKLVNNLRYVADGLHQKVHNMSMKKPDFANCGRALREDGDNLLTK